MTENPGGKRVIVAEDRYVLAGAVAERFLRGVHELTSTRTTHISLTGGSLGHAVLAAAAQHPLAVEIDWSRVHFWWSDERFVDASSDERNEGAARAALLDAITVPEENIHPIAAADDGTDLDAAATAYAYELSLFGTAEQPWPSFDISLLGVGPDGHIASLFPDRPEVLVTDIAALPVRDSPKPPPERVTLTRPVINSSQHVWLVLAGGDKASALGLALAGASYRSVPAAGAKGRQRTVFFVDADAAAQVPAELIGGDD